MNKIYIAIVSAAIGAALYGYFMPAKTITKTQTVTQVQERTITRIVKQKDGTEITTIDSTKNTNKEKTKSKSEVVAKNWHAGLVLSQDTSHITMLKPAYGIMAERRIIGPAFVGMYITPGQSAGLLLTVEF